MMTIQQAFEQAVQFHRANRLAEAEGLYRQILAVQPRHAGALHFLGLIAHQVGQHAQAAAWIRQALALDGHNADAHCDLGEVERHLGHLDLAMAGYHRAIALRPGHVLAHYNLGNALHSLGRREEAIAAYRTALAANPNIAQVHNNFGIALADCGEHHEAVLAYEQALRLEPRLSETWNNLGNALKNLDRLDEALAALRRGLEINPTNSELHYNLGNTLAETREIDLALRSYEEALRLRPDYAKARLNSSLLLLMRGDFAEGWPRYEARWEASGIRKPPFVQPAWKGEPLAGRRILVYTEQGLGDAIQFVRYAELVAQRGGVVIIQCVPRLLDLLRRAPGVSDTVAEHAPLPPFDFHVPLLTLPEIFRTRADNIPAPIPYLTADATRIATWRERLGATSRLRVGLVWAGNPDNRRARLRNVAFEKLQSLWAMPNVEFISLQLGSAATESASHSAAQPLVDFTAQIGDFDDTAALIAQLDLILTVDTSVAHLAGALGKPVWTLLPFLPDWRWGLQREDSPWYPTMRLFRQPAFADWDSVIERVAEELSRFPRP